MIWIFLHLDFVIQKKYGFLNGGWVGCRGVRRPMLFCTLCKDLSGKLGVLSGETIQAGVWERWHPYGSDIWRLLNHS